MVISLLILSMFLLRVAVFLLSSVAATEGEKLMCAFRPPPEIHVVPFLPQPPISYKPCDPSTQACFYFRYHGSRVSREFPVHGCLKFEQLPPQCKSGVDFYEPNWKINLRGEDYSGSIKCCSNDYCNEIEEPMFVPVHFNHESAGFLKKYFVLPILITIFVGLIFREHLPDFAYQIRRWLGLAQTADASENRTPLPMNPLSTPMFTDERGKAEEPDGDTNHFTPNVTGFFPSIQGMMEIIREIEKWDHEKEWKKEREERMNMRRERTKKKHGRPDLDKKDLTYNKVISNWQASEHCNGKVFREVPSRLTDLLTRMIEHGPYEFPFDPSELGDLFDNAAGVLADEPSVVEIDLGVHVIGNVEGSYIDLFRWFSMIGWPPKEKFVFLGGVIHPENAYSLEVLALILALKMKMPSRVYLIRGYAEGQPLNMGERFPPRITETLREVAAKALSRLPLAVLINKQILCIHSSLPNGMSTVEEINQIRRPLISYHRNSLEAYLLDAVPDQIVQKPNEQNGENPIAYVDEMIDGFLKKGTLSFLPTDLEETAKNLKLDLIIRAKSECSYGVSALAGNILSLWSAQGFGGAIAGAALHLDANGTISTTRIFKYRFFNDIPTNVEKLIFENSVNEELKRIDRNRQGHTALEQLRNGPIKRTMGFYV